MCEDITPGEDPSYQVCKEIYTRHPLGAKLAEAPIDYAQSQPRILAIPGGPEDKLKEAFVREWDALEVDKIIYNVMRLSRVYGLASVALMPQDGETSQDDVDFEKLYKADTLSFNVFDPLNTAGSLVMNQQPNSPAFLKTPKTVSVNGTLYSPTRIVVKLNEEPIYIGYSSSAFGFVGRSVYQRSLFPLRSYVQSMIADDLIVFKTGVIITKLAQAGSIVDNAMASMFGYKRNIVKEAQTTNVISIGKEDSIESLQLGGLEAPYGVARSNILKNIATAAKMPAMMVENETMVSGFGEGSEDAKNVAQYINRFRIEMNPIYKFFDEIVMYRAWNPDFYETIQAQFPEEFGAVAYKDAFYSWKNAFSATWPSLLEEPDSDRAKVDDIKLKAIIAMVEVMSGKLDPENNATLMQWAADNANSNEGMFTTPLLLDYQALAAYVPPVSGAGDAEDDDKPVPVKDTIRRVA